MEKEKLPKPEGGNTTNSPGKPRDHHNKFHGRGGGGHRRNGCRGGQFYNKHATKQLKFEGRISGLNGHVYDCADASHVDQYTNTTKEIALYVATTLKNGNDVRKAIEDLSIPTIKLPDDLPTDATAAAKRSWEKKVDECMKKELILEVNMKTLYSIIWGQCTELMRQRIQALPEYKKMNSDADSLTVLKAIRNQAFNYQLQKDLAQALFEATNRLQTIVQDRNMSCQEYMDRFQNTVDVIIHIAGSVPVYPSLVDAALKGKNLEREKATKKQIAQAEKDSTDRYLAMCFMLGADKYRFGKLIEDFENQHTQGMKAFPSTLSSAFGLINNWKNAPKLITKIIESDSDGIAFSQIDENKKEKQKQTKNPLATITCCKCQENGHYSHSCLKNKVTLRCC